MKGNKRVLVLGANGMLGHMITLYLRENGLKVDALTNSGRLDNQTIMMDVMAKSKFENFLKNNEYDVVVNAIGILTKMSDQRKDLASYLNSFFPHQLEYIFKNSKTKIIHCSTDCVFSGEHAPYKEDALYDGQLFYDRSKALGEIKNDKDLTFRQSIIGPDLNPNGIGLFNWFMAQKGEISGYTKAIWTGVTTLELAKGIKAAIEQNLTGLYHFVPNKNITKYNLLNILNDVFDRGLAIKADRKSMDSDKTLINTREDFKYEVAEYKSMVNDMKKWINDHEGLYKHYEVGR